MTDDDASPGVGQRPGDGPLARAGRSLVLAPPMDGNDDQIGLLRCSGYRLGHGFQIQRHGTIVAGQEIVDG